MKISTCDHYDPTKDKNYNNNKVANGWRTTPLTWTFHEILIQTTQKGISGNEWKTGHRSKENWMATHHIMLDFDNGEMTVDKLLKEQKSWKYNSYVYSSQNHQREKILGSGKIEPSWDRLRVLIPLEEPISLEIDRHAVENWFINKYPMIDKSFMHSHRYFAHGTSTVSSFIGNNSNLIWRDLPELYPLKRKKGRPSKKEILKKTFKLNDVVLDKNGKKIKIADVEVDFQIFCPVCGDAEYRGNMGKHNATKLINDDGLPIIYCFSCNSRNMGSGGDGIYNLHPDDAHLLMSEEKNALVFIDTIGCQYYSGCNEPGEHSFTIRELKNMVHAHQFCKYWSLPIPEAFPRARYEMKFASNKHFDYKNGYVNKYIPTEYLLSDVPEDWNGGLPEYTGKLIYHILGDDKNVFDYFINDMADFIQTRKKRITSFLLQGTEGTGKGLFFSEVIMRIIGKNYCTTNNMNAFKSQFNSFLSDNIMVLVNEVSGNFSSNERMNMDMTEIIKIAITDEHIQLEGKNVNKFNGRNSCSFMFATNREHGLIIPDDDRRFTVAPRQEKKIHDMEWWPGYNKMTEKLNSELQEVVWYLKTYSVNKSQIGKVLDNEPKRLLQIMSKTNADDFFEAIKKGDLNWINNHLVPGKGYGSEEEYRRIKTMLPSSSEEKLISVKDLCSLYNLINNKNLSPVSFGKMAAGKIDIPKNNHKIDRKQVWGIKISWKS